MKILLALLKKELTAQYRTGKLLILGLIFLAFGVMNPIIAKLTPLLFEMLEDTLADSGMSLGAVKESVLDSWTQFFKNIPMALLAFLIIESNCFTAEYRSGTLILTLTKGLRRSDVVISKGCLLALVWTVGYWLCFGVTYGINAVFWSNTEAKHLIFAAVCSWLLGVLTVAMIVFFSTVFSSNIGVLGVTGGIIFVDSMIMMIPKIGKWVPSYLSDGYSLIYGTAQPSDYTVSLIVTAVLTVGCLAAALPLFNRKEL